MDTLINSQSFIFGDPNWKFCKVGYSLGTLTKPDILICFYLLSEKHQNLLDIHNKNNVFANWEKQNELKLLSLSFKVVYWDHLTQLLPFTSDFVEKGQQLIWDQKGQSIDNNEK